MSCGFFRLSPEKRKLPKFRKLRKFLPNLCKLWMLPVRGTPKGLNSTAQGCVLATLGDREETRRNPEGVLHTANCSRLCRTPSGFMFVLLHPGLRVRNPGLWSLTPLG